MTNAEIRQLMKEIEDDRTSITIATLAILDAMKDVQYLQARINDKIAQIAKTELDND